MSTSASTIEARDAFTVAKKIRGWLKEIFSQAVAMGLTENNPASELLVIAAEAARYLPQRRHIMQWYADYLDALMDGITDERRALLYRPFTAYHTRAPETANIINGAFPTMTSLAEPASPVLTKTVHHPKYRPDIDGLRALAVLPVILFHAGISLFGGGYIGVDVFFVISGYLITSIIMSEKKSGTFKLSSFYKRRAKRILPVLLFVVASTIPVAWIFLPPKELEYFAQSIMATLAFCSNILFWLQSGYFDTAAELKPLLHTWSLAVEEQYYIVFPLLIMLLWKAGTKTIIATMTAILLASVAFSVWFVSKDEVGAFYLLPARAWEILTGAMLALMALKTTNRKLENIASFVGMLLILIPVFTYTSTTALTALYALPPVVGAALIIQFSKPGTVTYRLLTLRPMLWLGLLSYSAYLWHQPLLAFAKLRFSHDLSLSILAVLIITTFVLSLLTFRLIENPARKTKGVKSKATIGAAITGSLALAAIGYVGVISGGFPSRTAQFFSIDAQIIEENLTNRYTTDSQTSDFYKSVATPKKTILIVGDSYVRNWSVGINENIDHSQYRVISATYLGCDVKFTDAKVLAPPTETLYEKGCNDFIDVVNNDEIMKSVSKIFLASHRPFEYAPNQFRYELLRSLKERTGAQVYIFGNYYQFQNPDQGTCMNSMLSEFRGPAVCMEHANYPKERLSAVPAGASGYPDYTFVDIIDLACGYDKDKCPNNSDGVPFMIDWNHTTANLLKHIFSKIKSNNQAQMKELGLSDVFPL